MARTVQQVLVRVGILLQDKELARYTEDELLPIVVDGILYARTVRPDIFVGQYDVPIPDTLDPNDPLPIPDNLFAGLSYYVAGNAELRDDEFAQTGRAMNLKQAYTMRLLQGT